MCGINSELNFPSGDGATLTVVMAFYSSTIFKKVSCLAERAALYAQADTAGWLNRHRGSLCLNRFWRPQLPVRHPRDLYN